VCLILMEAIDQAMALPFQSTEATKNGVMRGVVGHAVAPLLPTVSALYLGTGLLSGLYSKQRVGVHCVIRLVRPSAPLTS
jgi:hypothetical protein